MNECNDSLNQLTSLTLDEFVRKVRYNSLRLKKLQEQLDWVVHLMFSIPGPVYGGVPSHSNVVTERIVELLDREDRIKRKIKQIEDSEKLLHDFANSLTSKEKFVFVQYWFKDKSQADIGYSLKISQQAVGQHINKINSKWQTFIK